MPTDLQVKIDALEARIAAFAGVRGTAIGDQSATFDYDAAVRELTRLKQLQTVAASGSTTRFAAFSKGL
jgi:hypothetical protein